MALVHECCGTVVYDTTGTYQKGSLVVPIPNVPTAHPDYIYENYAEGSSFRSSGRDGFMQEFIAMPSERLVVASNIPPQLLAITEFISIAIHAATRFLKNAHPQREKLAVWGDGSLGYITSLVLRYVMPHAHIVVIGHHSEKLAHFSFVDEVYLSEDIPFSLKIDHAFECTGGNGCSEAINSIIKYLRPQGCCMLMGVSETEVSINTRDVLEKGINFIGCSRSGREDFQNALKLMSESDKQKYLDSIIYEDAPVRSISDIHHVFATDTIVPFKTVFNWQI